jgi:tetratricopeptide (TPR) repeat protein
MWEESIAANRSSADASRAYAAMRHRDATEAEELHALDYLAYSCLQEGQDNKAREIVDFAATVRKTNPELDFVAAYALAAIPSRYALERNAWSDAAALPIPAVPHWSSFPFMEALIEYAHALGRAHTGDLEGARKAMDRMRQLRDATTDPNFDYFKRQLDQQMQAASAWVAYGENKKEEAVTMLRRAADAEDILGKHPVSPGALVPAREQLGDLLLALDRPKEAQREFEAALKIYPGRFRGLYGAAQAAGQTGEKEKAQHYYAKLTEQTAKADGSRSELAELREYRTADGATTQPRSVPEPRR